jgi:predicted DCC family thiol-disulfide oxidoreductase YuxK
MKRLACAWNRFWFASATPDGLGLVRMVFFSLLVLYYLRVDFSAWGDVTEAFWFPVTPFRVLRLPVFSVTTLELLEIAWKIALVLAALGLFTRLSTTAACVGGFYLLGLPNNFGKVHHNETLVVIALGILCLSRCGDAWSLDSIIRAARGHSRPEPSGEYTWPIRVAWTACAMVFFAAGVAKLRYGGLEWMFSDSLAIMLRQAAYPISNADPIGSFGLYVAQSPWLTRVMAVGSVILELSYPLALFSTGARRLIVPSVAAMQLGIRVLMGPPFEQYLFVYIFWLPWSTVPGRLAQRRPLYAMLFDGDCGLCQRTRRVVERLDILHTVAFYDVRNDWSRTARQFPHLVQQVCLSEMHVAAGGHFFLGFYAYRALAWALPAAWVLLPFLYMPGVPFVGRFIYARVAARRLLGGCPVPSSMPQAIAPRYKNSDR